MDLRQIEAFLVLCDELHFARTAERLYLTPGRVSQLIRDLEREAGAPLFERTSRQVRLTPLGRRLRDGVRGGADQLARTMAEVQAASRGVDRVLKVGYQASIRPQLGSRLAAVFEERHPRARVTLSAIHGGLAGPFESLRKGEADVLLVWSPGGDARVVLGDDLSGGPVLETDGRALLIAANHPLAARSEISVEDLAGHEILRPEQRLRTSHVNAWTPPATPSGRPIRQTDGDLRAILGRDTFSVEDLLTTISRTHLAHISFCSLLRRYPYEGLVLVPITDLPPCVVVPVWRTAAEDPAIRAFIRVAVDLAGTGGMPYQIG